MWKLACQHHKSGTSGAATTKLHIFRIMNYSSILGRWNSCFPAQILAHSSLKNSPRGKRAFAVRHLPSHCVCGEAPSALHHRRTWAYYPLPIPSVHHMRLNWCSHPNSQRMRRNIENSYLSRKSQIGIKEGLDGSNIFPVVFEEVCLATSQVPWRSLAGV